MNEDAASYLDRCREMGFGELVQFIEDSLARLAEPDLGGDRPHSQEEFWHLVGILREHGDVPKLAPVPFVYQPSETLKAKRDKLKRLHTRIRDAYGDPATKKRDIQQMKTRLPALEREVAELSAEEESDHAANFAQYRRHANSTRGRAVERIVRIIDRCFRAQPTGRIHWRPLPPDEATSTKIHRHYHDRLSHEGRLDKFDEDRLDKVTKLPYVEWWVPTEGFGGFDAYSIISFAHTDKVLLECPIYGNAAYVINAAEDVWREMTKQDLTDSGLAVRVPHQGQNWDAKIRRALELPELQRISAANDA